MINESMNLILKDTPILINIDNIGDSMNNNIA